MSSLPFPVPRLLAGSVLVALALVGTLAAGAPAQAVALTALVLGATVLRFVVRGRVRRAWS